MIHKEKSITFTTTEELKKEVRQVVTTYFYDD